MQFCHGGPLSVSFFRALVTETELDMIPTFAITTESVTSNNCLNGLGDTTDLFLSPQQPSVTKFSGVWNRGWAVQPAWSRSFPLQPA